MKSLHIGLSDHDIKGWLRTMDEDTSGSVDPAEFLEAVMQRAPTTEELGRIKGGDNVDSSGKVRTDNLKKGSGSGTKTQNEAITKQILLSLDTKRKRSVFGHFVTDANTLFHALDRDASGSVDKSELFTGLRRMGVHSSIKMINQWVNHLQLNDEGEVSRQTFISTLCHANQLTRHIHELCHDGGRQLFGTVITDAGK